MSRAVYDAPDFKNVLAHQVEDQIISVHREAHPFAEFRTQRMGFWKFEQGPAVVP
jgi:hypothetical protein